MNNRRAYLTYTGGTAVIVFYYSCIMLLAKELLIRFLESILVGVKNAVFMKKAASVLEGAVEQESLAAIASMLRRG